MYISISSKTKNSVRSFLSPIYKNQISRANLLIALSSISPKKMIPVISYNPNTEYIKDLMLQQANILRPHYKKLAYRIFENCSTETVNELKKIMTVEDIILLDIRDKKHTDSSLTKRYLLVNSIKNPCNCRVVILHQALTDKIKNTKLIDNHIIPEAITDLLTSYNSKYNFDAFGDFAGIKVPILEDIPVSSPSYIHYDSLSNAYIGFKGIYKEIKTFESMVLPKYTSSKYWSSLTSNHKNLCHGCKLVQGMLNGTIKANYAPRWKILTICHYIKSVDELL